MTNIFQRGRGSMVFFHVSPRFKNPQLLAPTLPLSAARLRPRGSPSGQAVPETITTGYPGYLVTSRNKEISGFPSYKPPFMVDFPAM